MLVVVGGPQANYRDKAFDARQLVADGKLGDIHHVLCVMYSPLMFLFDDPLNEGWVKPSGTMVGNGFGWGQLSHLMGWVLSVRPTAGITVHAASMDCPPTQWPESPRGGPPWEPPQTLVDPTTTLGRQQDPEDIFHLILVCCIHFCRR